MKKLLIPLLLALPLHAYAIDKFYIEGQLNIFNPSKVDSKTYNTQNFVIPGLAASGNLVQKYGQDTAAGLEVGIKINTNNRIAFSYTKPQFELKTLGIEGNIGTLPADATVSRAEMGTVIPEDTFDNDVTLFMLNYYYDFNLNEYLVPFLGVGAGFADFSNGSNSKQLARSLYGGAKYYFNEIIYVGGKLSYTTISGPTDQYNIKYDTVDSTAGSVLLGFEF